MIGGRASLDKMARALAALLLLLANDIEQNPGPPNNPDSSTKKLEKNVGELQKEVKSLKKVVDLLHGQMDSQGVRERPKLAAVIEEIGIIKETVSIQVSQSKRLKSDIATLEYDLTALKKVGAQQRNDLKQIGNLIMTELKALREKSTEQDKALKKEGKISEKFSADLPVMVTSLRVVGSGLAGLRKEVSSLRESSASQLKSVEASVSAMQLKTGQLTAELDRFEAEQLSSRQANGEQLTGLSQLLEAQIGLIKEHDQGLKQVQSRQEAMASSIALTSNDTLEKTEMFKRDLHSALDEWKDKYDQMASLVNDHDEAVHHMTSKLDGINMEFRSVLQNVDDQVNSSQLRLESMVALASDKALQMRQDLEVRSMEDRRILGHELRSQSEKVVSALQKLSLRLDELDGMYDDMQERLYEVDKSRKNNLVFYGIPQQSQEEDPDQTERLIKSVISTKLQVRREMILTKVVRLWNGPSFRGLTPILVTFHLFKDKEDILRKSPLLRGTNIYITEDYSRKVRKQRDELLKFARLVKSRQNGARCLLQYDRLYVDNDVYLFNEIEQRVQKVLMKMPDSDPHHQASVASQCKKSPRDAGIPAQEFEPEENCCPHCDHVRQERAAGSQLRRPRSRPGHLSVDDDLDFEATVVESLHHANRGRPHMMTLEAVEEEERTPGNTPSPSNFFPDIHHNQKMLI